MTVDYRVGDTSDVIATIPDGSVSLVASSPPFIALRSYLPDDHPDKALEIGSEPNPGAFLNRLLALTSEWGRVLAPWGSVAIELGDTYSGAGGYGNPDSPNPAYGAAGFVERWEGRTAKRFKRKDDGWPRPKCLALIPQAYALSLAYGMNVLTGQPSPAGQWLVRNVIVWHRPNPAVGALGDKVRPSTSYITVATRSAKRWFDLDAVRGEPSPNTHARTALGVASRQTTGKTADKDGNFQTLDTLHSTAGAPPLDCWFDQHDTWTFTTQPSSLAHYAMWPAKLAERLVLMMCPREVCTVCGEPRRRLTERPNAVGRGHARVGSPTAGNRTSSTLAPDVSTVTTIGWSDCGHGGQWEPGLVLDPFAGTGTTLAVADLHGRDAIGIDLDSRNRALYPRRREECARALFGTRPELAGQLGMFGEVAG